MLRYPLASYPILSIDYLEQMIWVLKVLKQQMLKSLYIFCDEKYEFFGYAKEENVKKEISKIRYSK